MTFLSQVCRRWRAHRPQMQSVNMTAEGVDSGKGQDSTLANAPAL